MTQRNRSAAVVILDCSRYMGEIFLGGGGGGREDEGEKKSFKSRKSDDDDDDDDGVKKIKEESKNLTRDGRRKTKFEMAKEIVILYLHEILLSSPKDEIGIVCVGTDETENALANDEDDGGYQNVMVAREVCAVDFGLIRHIEKEIHPSKTIESDLLDGIIVALDMLVRKTDKKKYDNTLLLISDGCSPVSRPEDADAVVEQMEKSHVRLKVAIIDDVEEEEEKRDFQYRRKKDMKEEEVVVAASKTKRGGGGGGGRGGSPTLSTNFLRDMCKRVGGEIESSRTFFENLRCFRSRKINPTTKCRTLLELTTSMAIPVWIYLKTKIETLPSLHKYSTLAMAASTEDEEEEERGGDDDEKKRRNREGKGAVRMERIYYKIDDVSGKSVSAVERTKAYKYGKQLVPITEADVAALKMETERCLTLLGVLESRKIHREWVINQTEYVVAEPNNPLAVAALSSFIHALYETEKILLCRFVWRKNSPPQPVVLYPKISSSMKCLYMLYMPFDDDMRTLSFPSLPTVSTGQLDVMELLVNSMSLYNKTSSSLLQKQRGGKQGGGKEQEEEEEEENDVNETKELILPKFSFNPTIQNFRQFLIHRSLHPKDSSMPFKLDLRLAMYLQPMNIPLYEVPSREAELKNLLTQHFPLEIMEMDDATSRRKTKKRYWKDLMVNTKGEHEELHKAVDVTNITVGSDEELEEAKEECRKEAEEEIVRKRKRRKELDKDEEDKESGGGGGSGGGGINKEDEEEEAFSITRDASVKIKVLEKKYGSLFVGSAQPVRDFEKMLKVKEIDLTETAIRQLCDVIDRSLKDSLGIQFHSKALNCLQCLRKACVKECEFERFNLYLMRLKDLCRGGGGGGRGGGGGGAKLGEFWTSVKEKMISLITKEEVEGSVVDEEEAKKFLEEGESSADLFGEEGMGDGREGGRGLEAEENIFDLIE